MALSAQEAAEASTEEEAGNKSPAMIDPSDLIRDIASEIDATSMPAPPSGPFLLLNIHACC